MLPEREITQVTFTGQSSTRKTKTAEVLLRTLQKEEGLNVAMVSRGNIFRIAGAELSQLAVDPNSITSDDLRTHLFSIQKDIIPIVDDGKIQFSFQSERNGRRPFVQTLENGVKASQYSHFPEVQKLVDDVIEKIAGSLPQLQVIIIEGRKLLEGPGVINFVSKIPCEISRVIIRKQEFESARLLSFMDIASELRQKDSSDAWMLQAIGDCRHNIIGIVRTHDIKHDTWSVDILRQAIVARHRGDIPLSFAPVEFVLRDTPPVFSTQVFSDC